MGLSKRSLARLTREAWPSVDESDAFFEGPEYAGFLERRRVLEELRPDHELVQCTPPDPERASSGQQLQFIHRFAPPDGTMNQGWEDVPIGAVLMVCVRAADSEITAVLAILSSAHQSPASS